MLCQNKHDFPFYKFNYSNERGLLCTFYILRVFIIFSFSAAASANAELRRKKMLNFVISKDASHEATHGSAASQHGDSASIGGQQRVSSFKKQSQSYSSKYSCPRSSIISIAGRRIL